jgi:REP element-mobilizing transposase RayT
MSSYRQILYHLVFRTKSGGKTIDPQHSKELFAFIAGIIKNNKSFLYQINGMEDHLHILCDLHPSIALADFMRDIKTSSSIWLKRSGSFKDFQGWADGYAAFTYAWRDKNMIVNYIKNQQLHHLAMSYEDELRKLLAEHGVEVYERFF